MPCMNLGIEALPMQVFGVVHGVSVKRNRVPDQRLNGPLRPLQGQSGICEGDPN